MHNCYPARRDEHTNDSGENSDRKCMFMIEKRLKREKQKNSTARHAAVYFMQRRRCSGSTQTDLNVSYDFARDFNYRHVPSITSFMRCRRYNQTTSAAFRARQRKCDERARR